MAHSDSEEEVEAIDDLDFDNRSSEVDEAIEEDAFEIEVDQEEGSDADEVCFKISLMTYAKSQD